jgi:hypothetical protein
MADVRTLPDYRSQNSRYLFRLGSEGSREKVMIIPMWPIFVLSNVITQQEIELCRFGTRDEIKRLIQIVVGRVVAEPHPVGLQMAGIDFGI